MNELFRFKAVGIEGQQEIVKIVDDFDQLLDCLNGICSESREFSICKAKLEEACFYAKKSIANKMEEKPVEKLETLSQSTKFLMSIYSRMDAVHKEPLDRPYMKGLRELINKLKEGDINE